MNALLRRIAALLAVAILIASVPFAASAADVSAAINPTSGLTASNLKAVTFPTASVGYAAGTNGTVVKTTDGGASWSVVRTGDGLDFTGVAFWDALSGIAVTSDRQVWGTDNGGATWDLRNPDVTLYAAGTPDIRVNGAASVPTMSTWASLIGGDPNPEDELFLGPTIGHTEVGPLPAGLYWYPWYEDVPYDLVIGSPEFGQVGEGEYFGIDFADSSRGWAVGADYYSTTTTSAIAMTLDGGYTWTRRYLGIATTLKAVSFASTLAGVTTSADGRAFYTTNGGTSWTEGSRPSFTSLDGVSMVTASTGWAVGAGGTVYKTTTGGATWSAGVSGTTNDLLAIANTGATSWVAVGKTGTIIRTTDGDTWVEGGADVSGPTMTSLASSTHPSSTTWYSNNDPAFAWSASDPSGVAGYSVVLDQSPLTTPAEVDGGAATTASFTDKADGTWYMHVRAVDTLGNWGSPSHMTVNIDTTPPSVISLASSTHAVETTWYSNNDPAFSWSPSDANSGVVGYSYVLDQSAGTVPDTTSEGTGTSTSFTDKADGVWYFHVRALDAAGNWGTAVHREVRIDSTGPGMTSVSSSTHPSQTTWYSNNDPAFLWGATDANSTVAGYSYEIDQASGTTPDTTSEGAAASASFTDKADGTWYFHVRAVDSLGNWGAASHVAVKIDTTKPTTADDHDAVYATAPAVITLTPTDADSGVVATYYTLDGVGGSATSVSTSVEGDHVLEYASVDAAGNRETSVTVNFTLDLSAPTVGSLASATHPDPALWYSNNDPTLSWSATAPSGITGYSWVFDQTGTTIPDEVSEGVTASRSFTNVADGTWFFHVRAVNGIGRWGSTAHLAVKIDTTKPSTSDNAAGPYAANVTITLTPFDASSGVVTTYWVLDGTPGTGTGISVTSEGNHTLEYASLDAAGNRETTQTANFLLDKSGPAISGLSSATHPVSTTWYSDSAPSFSWSGADTYSTVSGYSYELDQASGTAPDTTSEGTAASASFSGKADGTWYFHVRAIDSLGNWGTASHLQVRIDRTAPFTTAETAIVPGSATVTLSSFDANSGLAGISWSVVGGASGVGNTITLNGAGTYTVNYWAIDIAGNEETHREIQVVVPRIGSEDLIVTPIAGSNRIDTAIIASQKAFPTGAAAVVIATGFNWPDALGGAALAGALDAPILLTDPTTLSSAVSAEITRLGAGKAVILGGTGAVSAAVENALKSKLGTGNVTRVAGTNRYETACKIAEATAAEVGAGYDGTAFVATGGNFPDALGASPLAAANGWPIYLVDPRGVDSALVASMQSIGVTDAIMLGGTGAVSTQIESDLWSRVPCSTTRLAGGDRYDTARVVATYGVTDAGLGWDKVAIATGLNFPDALAGGVLQGRTGSVMLLTPGTSLYPGVASTLTTNKAAIFEVRFLGGIGAVSQSVRDAVVTALQ